MAWSREPDRYRGVPRALAHTIRVRDNYTCQQCGQPGHEVDHKTNVQTGGTDDPDNLWTLCTPCHNVKTKHETRAGQAAKRARLRLPAPPHPGTI